MSSFFYQCPSTPPDDCFRYATGEEVRESFREQREELAWLALFVTADTELAKVCVVDAFAVATTQKDVLAQSLERWTRCCTIRSAIEMRQSRISLLASSYERTAAGPHNHATLDPVVLDVLYEKPEELGLSLDVLCRAALVLRGIEKYSLSDSARMLGVSRSAVEAAYCAALDFCDILNCEMFMDSSVNARVCC